MLVTTHRMRTTAFSLLLLAFSAPALAQSNDSRDPGYISPLSQEILDHNIRYEYEYALVVGSLDDIRQYAYAQNIERGNVQLPRYVFDVDRSCSRLRQTA